MLQEHGLHSKDKGKSSKGLRNGDTIRFVILRLSPAAKHVVEEANVDTGVLLRELFIIQVRDGSACGGRSGKKWINSLRDLGKSSYKVQQIIYGRYKESKRERNPPVEK